MNGNLSNHVLEIIGLHVGLVGFTALCIWLGKRLVTFGIQIMKTGMATAHSWSRNRPPYDTQMPKAIGIFDYACGLIAFVFALLSIVLLILIDIQILLGVLKS